MLDVLEGDILVVAGRQYPIRSAAQWQSSKFMLRNFQRMATVTASTLRPAPVTGGKRGEPVTQIASLLCTPLDPADPEVRARIALETPHELLETFIADDDGFIDLVIEDLKR
jgi:hypothetical protein